MQETGTHDQASTRSLRARRSKKLTNLSIWPILGATGLLMLVVIALTGLSTGQNEATAIRLLTGQGAALIQAVENNIRIGLRLRRPIELQSFLSEMVRGDIRFVALVMPDGTILAHSSPSRVGEILDIDGEEASEALLQNVSKDDEQESVHWFMATMEGARTFVVYRPFMPNFSQKKRQKIQENNDGDKEKMREQLFLRRNKDLFKPEGVSPFMRPPFRSAQAQLPLIFLGLNIEPFERSHKQSIMQLWTLGGGGILVGLALLLSLYYAQRAQESRHKQHVAEGQVRELEAEVARKEKMAAIGNLAAGVAHEIRNPLSSIKGYATYFGQLFPKDSEDRQAAQVMVREVDRLNRVITDLIGLSRPTDIHAVPTDIYSIVEHSLQLLRKDTETNDVQVHVRKTRRVMPLVMVDVDRFGQALLNIFLNAIEAMPQGGHLFVSVYPKDKYSLVLEIKDTGHGINSENLKRIFNPYFTTKGHGTGLGLATVHKIIEAHGASISVYSQVATKGSTSDVTQALSHEKNAEKRVKNTRQEQGTTFTLYIPIATSEK